MIKVSCSYCGRIHPREYDCGKKRRFGEQDKTTKAYKFRHGTRWKEKSKAIRARDNYLCIYCKQKLGIMNNTAIEVHHIIPVKDDFDSRLDGGNLISLCREHHEAAEQGSIDTEELKKLAERQEETLDSDEACF